MTHISNAGPKGFCRRLYASDRGRHNSLAVCTAGWAGISPKGQACKENAREVEAHRALSNASAVTRWRPDGGGWARGLGSRALGSWPGRRWSGCLHMALTITQKACTSKAQEHAAVGLKIVPSNPTVL